MTTAHELSTMLQCQETRDEALLKLHWSAPDDSKAVGISEYATQAAENWFYNRDAPLAWETRGLTFAEWDERNLEMYGRYEAGELSYHAWTWWGYVWVEGRTPPWEEEGLTMEEWDKPHLEKQRRAAAAHKKRMELAQRRKVRTPDKPHSLRELDALPDPEYLIGGLVPSESVGILYGPPESFKSFITLDMALSIACGLPFHGRATGDGKYCLYCPLEGAGGMKLRVRAWLESHGLQGLYDQEDQPFNLDARPLNVLDPADVDRVIAYIKSRSIEHPTDPREAGLVVIDTLHRAKAGGSENDDDVAGQMVAAQIRIRNETGATVIFVHHSGKDANKGARGSSAFRGDVDFELKIARKGDSPNVTLSVKKQREDEKDPGLHLKARQVELSNGKTSLVMETANHKDAAPPEAHREDTEAHSALSDNAKRVLSVIESAGASGLTAADIGQRLEREDREKSPSQATLYRILSELKEVGLAQQNGTLYQAVTLDKPLAA